MTDIYIIGMSERCIRGKECDKCPYYELGRPDCMLELIKRQKAGIDSLNFNIETYRLMWAKATAKLDTAEAEIERLNNTIDDILDRQPLLVEWAEKYAKADAIKEFAELVKAEMDNLSRMDYHCEPYFLVSKSFIDNLVKERIGADNGNS